MNSLSKIVWFAALVSAGGCGGQLVEFGPSPDGRASDSGSVADLRSVPDLVPGRDGLTGDLAGRSTDLAGADLRPTADLALSVDLGLGVDLLPLNVDLGTTLDGPGSSPPPPSLGSAANYGALAGAMVTNTGPTVITGDVGV